MVGLYICLDSYSEAEFLRYVRTSDVHEPLIRMVHSLMRDDNALQGLKDVYLYGLTIDDASDNLAYQWLKYLEGQGVTYETRVGAWLLWKESSVAALVGCMDWDLTDDEDNDQDENAEMEDTKMARGKNEIQFSNKPPNSAARYRSE
jgi:hypothetical protein